MPEKETASLLPSIVLLMPFFSALVILLGHKVLKGASVMISLGSAIIGFLGSLALLGATDQAAVVLPFLEVGKQGEAGAFSMVIDTLIDQQSRGMMFIVTFVGLLVHIFSLGYMKEDPARPRFFGALSLFMFSMTGIVLAGNLLMMFIFWELVGLSSYLLIGHWYERDAAAEACKKAFITNRIGDFGFMIGILLLFAANHGDISFAGLQDSFVNGPLHHMAQHQTALTAAAALCIFMGAVGKSAQFPLHVWLPDAMEGPTPVSALIHAATMVAAGVYMLVRMSFLIEASPLAAQVIAGIGGFTAILAALMATQQNDIKRVLAYSTLSQLGYMVMAVGLVAMQIGHGEPAGPGHPAMFHLYTHAFFKALLFLGAGAIIHACHHEQDMWKMGGLRKHMPLTFGTFAIGTAALMGVPGLSGFWSKEAILGVAFEECRLLFWVGSVTAMLTAFYMTRLFLAVFFGKARSASAHHATEAPLVMVVPLALLAMFSIGAGYKWFGVPLAAMIPHHAQEHHTVLFASLCALVLGVGGAFMLYRGRDVDPLPSTRLRPAARLFANKFYFDEAYAVIVKVGQDWLAWVVTGIERVFVDGLVARLPAALIARVGSATRILHGGHLQAYTFWLGAGVLLVIYLIVFVLPETGH